MTLGTGIKANHHYVATVVANDDPKKEGRIRARVRLFFDNIPDNHLPWARPSWDHHGGASADHGVVDIPLVDSKVLIQFQDGDAAMPFYSGYYIDESTKLQEADVNYPTRTVNVFPSGTLVVLDATTNQAFMKIVGELDLFITGDANITINGNLNQTIKGNVTTIIEGNSATLVKGNVVEITKGNKTEHVEKNDSQIIKGNRSVGVSGNLQEGIEGNRTLGVTGTDASISGTKKIFSKAAMTLKAAADLIAHAGGTMGTFGAENAIGAAGLIRINAAGFVGSTESPPSDPSAPSSPSDPTIEDIDWEGIRDPLPGQ